MYHDYTGKHLHEEHYQDLLKETEGGWRLRAAEAEDKPKARNGRLGRVLFEVLFTALVVGLLVASVVATLNAA